MSDQEARARVQAAYAAYCVADVRAQIAGAEDGPACCAARAEARKAWAVAVEEYDARWPQDVRL